MPTHRSAMSLSVIGIGPSLRGLNLHRFRREKCAVPHTFPSFFVKGANLIGWSHASATCRLRLFHQRCHCRTLEFALLRSLSERHALFANRRISRRAILRVARLGSFGPLVQMECQ